MPHGNGRNRVSQQVHSTPTTRRAKSGGDLQQTGGLIAQRERQRRIKLHDEERELASNVQQAVVKTTTTGLPDMRIAENREMFLRDPSKKKSGAPDFRFLENREDLLAIHAQRGETNPNVIFADDGTVLSDEELDQIEEQEFANA